MRATYPLVGHRPPQEKDHLEALVITMFHEDGDKQDQKIFGSDVKLLIFATRFENDGCGEGAEVMKRSGKLFAGGKKKYKIKRWSSGEERLKRLGKNLALIRVVVSLPSALKN